MAFNMAAAAQQLGFDPRATAFLQAPRAARATRQSAPQGYLTPEEEEGIIQKTGSAVVGGIGTAGALLDYDSGAIRNLLVGKAPSINPISSQGRATGRDVLEHWGVLGKNKPGFDWGDVAGFAAEVALDPKTYFAFGAGAVSRAGKALQKAGLWDFVAPAADKAGLGRMAARQKLTNRDILDAIPANLRSTAENQLKKQGRRRGIPEATLMSQPLGGAAKFWPAALMGAEGGGVIGKAGGVGGMVASALDPIGKGIRYSAPVRWGYGALHPKLHGQTAEGAQKALLKRAAENELMELDIGQTAHRQLAAVAKVVDFNNEPELIAASQLHRDFVEGLLEKGPDGRQILPAEHEPLREILNELRDRQASELKEDHIKGLATGDLGTVDTMVDYLRRGKTQFAKLAEMYSGARVVATHPSQRHRSGLLTNWRGGTRAVNRLSLDEAVSGVAWRNKIGPKMSNGTRKQLIHDWTKKRNPATQKLFTPKEARLEVRRLFPHTSRKGVPLNDMAAHIKREYAEVLPEGMDDNDIRQLAAMASEWHPRHVSTGTPLFANHPLTDDLDRQLMGAKARSNADAIYDMLGTAIRGVNDVTTQGPAGAFNVNRQSLTAALKGANLTGPGASRQMIDRLPDDLVRINPNKTIGGSVADGIRKRGETYEAISDESVLNEIYVPKDVADAVSAVGKAYTRPDIAETAMGQLGQFWDSWVNFFKAHVTAYWPAFISRNFTSSQLQNVFGGAYNLNPFARDGIFHSINDTFAVLRGKPLPHVLDIPMVKEAGITDPAEATKFVLTSLSGGGLGGKFQAIYANTQAGSHFQSAGDVLSMIPGERPIGKEILGHLIPGSRGGKRPGWKDPMNIRGVRGRTESEFFLFKFGDDANYVVEQLARYAPALAMLRRGDSALSAIKRVNLMQVDYRLSGQADPAIRRVIPFWSFLKGQTQYLAKELSQRPGGGVAQVIRGEASLQREGLPGAVPEHIAKTAAIPLGTTPEGGIKVATTLGLMHEDPLSFLGGTTNRGPMKAATSMVGTAGREAFSRLAPQLSVPIELATGVSLWQSGPRGGRPLLDQYGQIGGILSQAHEKITGTPKEIKLHQGVEQLPQLIGVGRHISSLGKALHKWKGPGEKAADLLTGVRLTTITPEHQEKVVQDAVHQTMVDLNAREFSRPYFSKKYLEKLPVAEQKKRQDAAALFRLLDTRARDRYKAKAKRDLL